jgi:autotransporter strand-loop-strand O-heptosyltransferase
MKTIFIYLLSNSLGDTIAATPYVSEYQKKHDVNVIFGINNPFIILLNEAYDNIQFVGRNEVINYDEKITIDYVFNKSIQGGYAEQLGFENPEYIRPRIITPILSRPIKNKYIALGVHSTCQIKYWNHPDGIKSQPESKNWNELSVILRKRGYTPVTVEKDEMYGVPPFYNGVPSKSNKQIGKSLQEAVNLIFHSEFYIGLSSGMTWVAHAMGKKVAMISNFTEDWNEFDLSCDDYIRITNKSVCHGCWNRIDVDFPFNKSDWYWCPLHQNTERQFECHKSITVDDVVGKIQKWLD